MTKHTPGPWTLYEHRPQHATSSEFSVSARCEAGNGYAGEGWFKVVDCVNGGGDDECRANARLIAAAPDLLEALKLMVAQFTKGSAPSTVKDSEARIKAHAAIAKAEGQQ